jgi:hypothetical protein
LLSTLTVTNTKDRGNNSLRYEIAHASQNDTIVFAPRLDGQTITLTSGELDITTGLTIQGPGAGQLTISGGNNTRVFDVNASAPVVLSGLTVSGGDGFEVSGQDPPYHGDGGGILNLSTLTLNGCVVSGNSVAQLGMNSGGGIYNAGSLTLTGCTVSNNNAWGSDLDTTEGFGGGIYNAGTLTVSNSTLSGNSAYNGDGGGIYNAGTLTVTGCTISNNNASGSDLDGTGFGGGIYNAGTLTVSSSTFNSNWSDPYGTPIENNIYGSYTDGGGNSFS